jgi:hypothetical protein
MQRGILFSVDSLNCCVQFYTIAHLRFAVAALSSLITAPSPRIKDSLIGTLNEKRCTVLNKNIERFYKLKMENGRMMLLHSVLLGVVLYLVMVFALGQRQVVAENRSILLAALALAYMVLFGHGLPKSVNKDLF